MHDFVSAHYRVISSILLGIALILAFLLGRETAGTTASPAVVLSCDEKILANLAIPTHGLATGDSGASAENYAITEPVLAPAQPVVAGASTEAPAAAGKFVGSKNGTKYYLPTCATVKRIKPENYVWFEDAEDAVLQGYSQGAC